MIDDAIAFLAGPIAFINGAPIALNAMDEDIVAARQAFPIALDDLRGWFTLSRQAAVPNGPAPLPSLKMQVANLQLVRVPTVPPTPAVRVPGGGVLTLIDGYYLNAANGGTLPDAMRYCDIPAVPTANDALFLFTLGMNGCSLVVLSAVPQTAPPLAQGHLRVVHDRDHRNLAAWAQAGYTVQFAAYDDAGAPGPVPAGWATTLANYNPHDLPWTQPTSATTPPLTRVVTNFLFWTGANWTFCSRHFFDNGTNNPPQDAEGRPILMVPPVSTQNLPI